MSPVGLLFLVKRSIKYSDLNMDLTTNWRSDGSGLVGVLGVAGVTTRE